MQARIVLELIRSLTQTAVLGAWVTHEGAKVALVERALLGGASLDVGCVPSKAIIRTSRLYAEMRNAEHYGAQVPADIRVDFAAVMQRMRRIRARIGRFDSAQRLSAAAISP